MPVSEPDHDGWATSPSPTLVGGRYTLVRLIRGGGAAEVFRAYDHLLQRPVAVKLFPADASRDEGDRGRRWREVRTLAGLNHPGLVAVYDVGEDQGRWFFVMQLIEGHDLATRLAAGPLGVEQTLELGAALADGLAHVHRHGVVHGDVKPANVLLDAAGRPYLGDFGVATSPTTTESTIGDAVHGTPSYLAPEHVTDQPVDTPADVYALGLVVLECLTGRREYPLNASDSAATALARLHRPPHIPEHLATLVRDVLSAMTAFEAAERPTAITVAAGLRALLPSPTKPDDIIGLARVPTGPTAYEVERPHAGAVPPAACVPVAAPALAAGRVATGSPAHRPANRSRVALLVASAVTLLLATATLLAFGPIPALTQPPVARADPPSTVTPAPEPRPGRTSTPGVLAADGPGAPAPGSSSTTPKPVTASRTQPVPDPNPTPADIRPAALPAEILQRAEPTPTAETNPEKTLAPPSAAAQPPNGGASPQPSRSRAAAPRAATPSAATPSRERSPSKPLKTSG